MDIILNKEQESLKDDLQLQLDKLGYNTDVSFFPFSKEIDVWLLDKYPTLEVYTKIEQLGFNKFNVLTDKLKK